MESLFAHLSSRVLPTIRSKKSQFKNFTLADRLTLLRFCLPFEVFPLSGVGSEIKKHAMVFDMFVHQTLSEKESVWIFSLVSTEKNSFCCFDAHSLLKTWNITNYSEPLREIGCMLSHPYYDGYPTKHTSLLDFLCLETFDIFYLPRMHSSAQDILKKRALEIFQNEYMFFGFRRIYRDPHHVEEHFPNDDAWRPALELSKVGEEQNSSSKLAISWARIGSLIYSVDSLRRMCVYVHPIITSELNTHLKNSTCYDHLFDKNEDDWMIPSWNPVTLLLIFSRAFDDLDGFEISDENGWISMDHVIRMAVNVPALHVGCAGDFNQMYSILWHLKKEIYNALQHHIWSNVMVVDMKFVSASRMKKVAYEVCLVSGKYLMRKHFHTKHDPLNPNDFTIDTTLQQKRLKCVIDEYGETATELKQVLAGAKINPEESPGLTSSIKLLREKFVTSKILIVDSSVQGLILTRDYEFHTAKEAASFITGRNFDLQSCWRIQPNNTPLSTLVKHIDQD